MQRLGIDYGTVRIGLALGTIMPVELKTLLNNDSAVDDIIAIVNSEDVQEIVIGEPRRSQGEHGTMEKAISRFIQALQSKLRGVPIVRVDEAYTSSQAKVDLTEAGCGPAEVAKRIDQYAAKLLLEQYNRDYPVQL